MSDGEAPLPDVAGRTPRWLTAGRSRLLAERQRSTVTVLAVIAGMMSGGELLYWLGGGFAGHRWASAPLALGVVACAALVWRRRRPLSRAEGQIARFVLSYAFLCGRLEAIVRPGVWHSWSAILSLVVWACFPWWMRIVPRIPGTVGSSRLLGGRRLLSRK